TAVGAAGGALGIGLSPRFTGGKATTADTRFLLYGRLIVVQDRAGAAILGEQRIAAVAGQVQVERLIGLSLGVAIADDRDGFRRLAGIEGQRAGLGDIVTVTR